MKTLRKLTAVILSVALIFGCVSALSTVFAEDDTLKFAVASDIHAKEKDAELHHYHPESELYFHAENSGNLYHDAIGILVSFLKQAQDEKVDFVLLPGDMTNSGTEEQHTYFASVLADFEKESGIPVYVTPGNHDYKNTGPDDFKKYYADFGYNEALCVDENTASYTVDLPCNYRLISIDTCVQGKDGDGLNDAIFSWIDTQVKQAQADGKTLISTMHHPLLDPIPLAQVLMKDFIVRDHKEVAEKFAQWGIQYSFTGHEHGNNITSYTGKNGKKVYDILTTSLTSYPLEYRLVTFTPDKVDIKCKQITECNFDYVCDGYTEDQLKLMKENYTEYAYNYFTYSIECKIAKYIQPDFLKGKLGSDSGVLADAIDIVMPTVEEALRMPLYAKDTDGVSVESLAKAAKVTLPASDYSCLFDLATATVAKVYYGNEQIPFEKSPEGKVLVVGLNTMLKYILNEAGNDAVSLVANSILEDLGLNAVDEFDVFFINKLPVPGAETVYRAVYSILGPLLNKFLVDDELCDRDVTLPAPADAVETKGVFARVIDKILAFFKYLLSVVTSFVKA